MANNYYAEMDNNFLDDSLAELQKKVYNTQKLRKQVEKENNIIQRRIELLNRQNNQMLQKCKSKVQKIEKLKEDRRIKQEHAERMNKYKKDQNLLLINKRSQIKQSKIDSLNKQRDATPKVRSFYDENLFYTTKLSSSSSTPFCKQKLSSSSTSFYNTKDHIITSKPRRIPGNVIVLSKTPRRVPNLKSNPKEIAIYSPNKNIEVICNFKTEVTETKFKRKFDHSMEGNKSQKNIKTNKSKKVIKEYKNEMKKENKEETKKEFKNKKEEKKDL
ncbi:MAG: hypothetical protein MJ252_21200, partial [archaeon]|nr:hypothetical protein [archaeon]